MELFVSEGNPHCLKVLAALEVTGVQCAVQFTNHEGKTLLAYFLFVILYLSYTLSILCRDKIGLVATSCLGTCEGNVCRNGQL